MILSSFEDAVKTYDLTCRIREASEVSTRELYGSVATIATLGATSAEATLSLKVARLLALDQLSRWRVLVVNGVKD